jgi:hypothetical protein
VNKPRSLIGNTVMAGLALLMTVGAPAQAFADDVLDQWVSHTSATTVQSPAAIRTQRPIASRSTESYAIMPLPTTPDVEQQWFRQSSPFQGPFGQAMPTSAQASRAQQPDTVQSTESYTTAARPPTLDVEQQWLGQSPSYPNHVGMPIPSLTSSRPPAEPSPNPSPRSLSRSRQGTG